MATFGNLPTLLIGRWQRASDLQVHVGAAGIEPAALPREDDPVGLTSEDADDLRTTSG